MTAKLSIQNNSTQYQAHFLFVMLSVIILNVIKVRVVESSLLPLKGKIGLSHSSSVPYLWSLSIIKYLVPYLVLAQKVLL
jgi:hypothetical protein